jgi:hypothetical protein
MLKCEYKIGRLHIREEDKEAYAEKIKEIEKEINNNILNKILKIN